jgi:regulator of cell morphogenesis and NO signaling
MTQEQTVADFVLQDIRTATVFKKFGIDFCCGGGKGIQMACDEKGVDFDSLMDELNLVMDSTQSDLFFPSMPLGELIDHIYKTHHKYIYDNGPITAQFVNKVAHVHGERHPETVEVAKVFNELLSELNHHMMKEENIIFPYVKSLLKKEAGLSDMHFQAFVSQPVRVMEMEHDHAGEILKKLSELTSEYTPPVDACNTYKAAYANLGAMEDDIHFHIHLENNILFPKAIELENNLVH